MISTFDISKAHSQIAVCFGVCALGLGTIGKIEVQSRLLSGVFRNWLRWRRIYVQAATAATIKPRQRSGATPRPSGVRSGEKKFFPSPEYLPLLTKKNGLRISSEPIFYFRKENYLPDITPCSLKTRVGANSPSL